MPIELVTDRPWPPRSTRLIQLALNKYSGAAHRSACGLHTYKLRRWCSWPVHPGSLYHHCCQLLVGLAFQPLDHEVGKDAVLEVVVLVGDLTFRRCNSAATLPGGRFLNGRVTLTRSAIGRVARLGFSGSLRQASTSISLKATGDALS